MNNLGEDVLAWRDHLAKFGIRMKIDACNLHRYNLINNNEKIAVSKFYDMCIEFDKDGKFLKLCCNA